MTRLSEGDIKGIPNSLKAYDLSLVRKTGFTLKEIAAKAAGITKEEIDRLSNEHIVGVVPTTFGEGLINGFTESVVRILDHVGATAFKASAVDVAGFAEVIERGAEIAFLADDNRFVAVNLPLCRVVDNIRATAHGYIAALETITGDIKGREVLIIGGAGRLGWSAAQSLKKKEAKVSIFDTDRERVKSLVAGQNIRIEEDLEEALHQYDILFDATPAENIIKVEHVKPDIIIVAPGIPIGLSEDARVLIEERLIHDSLQIGVATMLAEAILGFKEYPSLTEGYAKGDGGADRKDQRRL